jgi:palmitoyltransferase
MQADYYAKNVYGASVLHISAQGDQPAPLYYFARIKDMDINDVDNRGTTPLHWACFSKSEFALSYILALNPNLEVQDWSGLTPLHLAIKSVGDLKSTRPVRALLLKGASRAATNKKGETCTQMIKDDVSHSMRKEL